MLAIELAKQLDKIGGFFRKPWVTRGDRFFLKQFFFLKNSIFKKYSIFYSTGNAGFFS